MYNPFLNSTAEMLEPVYRRKKDGFMERIFGRISSLDGDDLLIMLIIYLIMKDNEKEDIWPLLAALLYCVL